MAEAAAQLVRAGAVVAYLPEEADPGWLARAITVPMAPPLPAPDRIARADAGSTIREEGSLAQRIVLVPVEGDDGQPAALIRLSGLAAALTPNDHDALGILAAQAAIALQNVTLHERALIQAAADGLTGLPNHKQFQGRLEAEVARARRTGRDLSVIMVDLDDFRSVNNTHGHPTGDALLQAVAETLRQLTRLEDIPARYGGDEFAVILPDTAIAEGLLVADRIQVGLASLRLKRDGLTIGIGASLGVASLPLHAADRAALIEAADHAAYAAKRRGKHRVCRPEDRDWPPGAASVSA